MKQNNLSPKFLSISIILAMSITIIMLVNVGLANAKLIVSPVIDRDSLIENPNTVPVIIGFKDKVADTDITSLHSFGGLIKRNLKEINAVSVRIPPQRLDSLRKNPRIIYVTDNNKGIQALAETLPWGIDKIDAELVHSQYKGTGVVVAVLDTGIDYNHEDLIGNVLAGHNYINNGNDPMDDRGHGTHVAGIIAAKSNNIGVVGVAPESSLLPMKMLDSNGIGNWDDAAASVIDSTNSGAKIISMSWGGCVDNPTLKAAIQYAYSQGVLLVASAGNQDCGTTQILYPAAYPEVIAVTSTDQNDNIASSSSIGPEAEASAPGVSILSTVPKGSCALCDPTGYRLLGGTSMAAPHVSGEAALIWSAHTELTRNQVRSRITGNVIDLGSPGRDILYGYGRINAYTSILQASDCQNPSSCVDVKISPSTQNVTKGKIFYVKIDVDPKNLFNVVEVQADYRFSTLVSATGVVEGNFLNRGGSTIFRSGTINNPGTIISNIGDDAQYEGGQNTVGTLVNISMNASSLGTSPLNIERLFVYDTNGQIVPARIIPGEVIVKCDAIWDVNHDGITNIFDIVPVGQHFGQTTSLPYPPYDVNTDGIINIFDIVPIGQHFGQGTCWI